MIFDRISNFCIRDRDRLSRKEAFSDKSRSAIDWNDYTDNESRTIVLVLRERTCDNFFILSYFKTRRIISARSRFERNDGSILSRIMVRIIKS